MALLAATIAVACSSETQDPGASGPGDAAPLTACDRIGLCGDGIESLSNCQQCAITEGSCVEVRRACDEEPTGACLGLNACYLACPQSDEECYAACDAAVPEGVAPFQALVGCVFCVECVESCNVDRSGCG